MQASLSGTLATMGDLNQVTWEQRSMSGDPKYMGSPHIKYEQGKKAAKAALHDPERRGIATKGFRKKLAELYEAIPGRGDD